MEKVEIANYQMLKEQFNRRYANKDVRCLTKESANNFIKIAKFFGYDWYSEGINNKKITTNYWERFEEETCYYLNEFEGTIEYLKNDNISLASKPIFESK